MNQLEGKTAVITGASRGIGLAVAERLVAEGARVVITARKKEALEEAVATLGGSPRPMRWPGRPTTSSTRRDRPPAIEPSAASTCW